MTKAVLIRLETGIQGTFGLLQSGGFSCYVSELPWNDNLRQYSCIPEGRYLCKWHKSPKFGWVYKLFNVPNRSEILIHSGNLVGDSRQGLIAHSHGCLLPARALGRLGNQKAGLMSKPAVNDLVAYFNKNPFELEIINAFNRNRPSV